MKHKKCQYVEGCTNDSEYKITVRWSASPHDIDTFFMCEKCALLKKKECEDWSYVWKSEPPILNRGRKRKSVKESS